MGIYIQLHSLFLFISKGTASEFPKNSIKIDSWKMDNQLASMKDNIFQSSGRILTSSPDAVILMFIAHSLNLRIQLLFRLWTS